MNLLSPLIPLCGVIINAWGNQKISVRPAPCSINYLGKCTRSSPSVGFTQKNNQQVINQTSRVYFKTLSQSEIDYYIEEYQPYDKAGAYGIQEWIGTIGIEKIEGSYTNIVGLPVAQVLATLEKFAAHEKDA